MILQNEINPNTEHSSEKSLEVVAYFELFYVCFWRKWQTYVRYGTRVMEFKKK